MQYVDLSFNIHAGPAPEWLSLHWIWLDAGCVALMARRADQGVRARLNRQPALSRQGPEAGRGDGPLSPEVPTQISGGELDQTDKLRDAPPQSGGAGPMNSQPAPERTGLAYVAGILGALPDRRRAGVGHAPLHSAAAAGRRPGGRAHEGAGGMRAAEAEALTTPAWLDQGKGIVRLPIDEAMEIVRGVEKPRRGPLQPDCPRGKGHGRPAQGSGETQPVRVSARF